MHHDAGRPESRGLDVLYHMRLGYLLREASSKHINTRFDPR